MPRCNLCLKRHALRHCTVFRAMTVEKRRGYLLKWGYCLNCLAHTHQRQLCDSQNRCAICGAKHHSMVHQLSPHDLTTSSIEADLNPQAKAESNPQEEADSSSEIEVDETQTEELFPYDGRVGVGLENLPSSLEVLLMELPVLPAQWELTIPPIIQVSLIYKGAPMRVTFLLDDNVQMSYLLRSTAKLFPDFKPDSVKGDTEMGDFEVAPSYERQRYQGPIARWRMPLRDDATRVPPAIKDPRLVAHFKSLVPPAHPDFATCREIDGVIGRQTISTIMRERVVQPKETLPKAELTIFGWVISGVWDGCGCH